MLLWESLITPGRDSFSAKKRKDVYNSGVYEIDNTPFNNMGTRGY